MLYHVGDKVIHVDHGLGEVVHIEEKTIHGRSANCYVVRTQELTVWIPIDDLHQHSLRMPATTDEFEKLFVILNSPSETLPEDRVLRKDQLSALLRDGQLASICRVVRDLTHFMRNSKLNDQEKSILERATKSLITECAYSLGLSKLQAQREVEKQLQA